MTNIYILLSSSLSQMKAKTGSGELEGWERKAQEFDHRQPASVALFCILFLLMPDDHGREILVFLAADILLAYLIHRVSLIIQSPLKVRWRMEEHIREGSYEDAWAFLEVLEAAPRFQKLPQEERNELLQNLQVFIYEFFERKDELLSYLEKLSLEKGELVLPEDMAQLYFDKGDYGKARETLDAHLIPVRDREWENDRDLLDSFDAPEFYLYAATLAKLGGLEKARIYLERALELDPHILRAEGPIPGLGDMSSRVPEEEEEVTEFYKAWQLELSVLVSPFTMILIVIFAIMMFGILGIIRQELFMSWVPGSFLDVLLVSLTPILFGILCLLWFYNFAVYGPIYYELIRCHNCQGRMRVLSRGSGNHRGGRCPYCGTVITPVGVENDSVGNEERIIPSQD